MEAQSNDAIEREKTLLTAIISLQHGIADLRSRRAKFHKMAPQIEQIIGSGVGIQDETHRAFLVGITGLVGTLMTLDAEYTTTEITNAFRSYPGLQIGRQG